jgi:ketosteroid isomerase-like protein
MRPTTLLLLVSVAAAPAVAAPQNGIAAFNARFEQATRQMDNSALADLWEDDGISLLPDTPPIIGKPAITAFVQKVTAQFPHASMKSFTMLCDGVIGNGALASEWCFEHQVVDLGNGKSFDGRGRMLLVLRHGAGGRWRLLREMWIPAEASAQ